MLLCALSVCAPAQESSDGGPAAAIRALEHQWADGQSHNDNGVLDLIFDNSLVYVEYGKLVSKGNIYCGSRRRAHKSARSPWSP